MKVSDDDLEKDLERMRQHMREKLGALARPGAAVVLSHAGWRPSLDLYETKEEFLVLVDVPGIQPQYGSFKGRTCPRAGRIPPTPFP